MEFLELSSASRFSNSCEFQYHQKLYGNAFSGVVCIDIVFMNVEAMQIKRYPSEFMELSSVRISITIYGNESCIISQIFIDFSNHNC